MSSPPFLLGKGAGGLGAAGLPSQRLLGPALVGSALNFGHGCWQGARRRQHVDHLWVDLSPVSNALQAADDHFFSVPESLSNLPEGCSGEQGRSREKWPLTQGRGHETHRARAGKRKRLPQAIVQAADLDAPISHLGLVADDKDELLTLIPSQGLLGN